MERGSRWILFFSLSFQLFIVGTVVDAFPYDFYFSGIWGSSYLRVSVTRSLQYFSYFFFRSRGVRTNAPPLSAVEFVNVKYFLKIFGRGESGAWNAGSGEGGGREVGCGQ